MHGSRVTTRVQPSRCQDPSARVVYGATDPKAGAAGSLWDVLRDRRLSSHIEVIGGVLEDEGANLLREFFAGRREDDPAGPGGST